MNETITLTGSDGPIIVGVAHIVTVSAQDEYRPGYGSYVSVVGDRVVRVQEDVASVSALIAGSR